MDNDMVMDVLNILHGIHELTEGMSLGIYSRTAEGVLKEHDQLNELQNAHTFVCNNYEMTAGAFRLISASMSIITRAITNDELNVTGKEGG